MTIHRGSTVFVVLILSRAPGEAFSNNDTRLPTEWITYRPQCTGPISSHGVGVLVKTLINLASLTMTLWQDDCRTGLMNAGS